MGYGRMAVRTITPVLTRHFVRRCSAVIGLTLLVHIPMQAAYVIVAHNLSPQTPIADLIAASAIVMFATSVPISLAGWGMREMSAVVGLGAIGVSGHAALATAVIIGIGSLLVVGLIAAVSLPGVNAKRYVRNTQPAKSVDYFRVLAWVLPIGTATLVLFQIFVPIPSGVLNVNLADPLAVLGGVLFVLGAARNRKPPQWRVPNINLAIVVGTVVLVGSLLLGASRFGWTTWAVTNRFFGWFVISGYAATGALIVSDGRKEGFRVLLLTFVGAAAAIAGIEATLVALKSAGFQVSVVAGSVEGFAQNRNASAFQLLMALSAAIVLVRGPALRIAILAAIVLGLWFADPGRGGSLPHLWSRQASILVCSPPVKLSWPSCVLPVPRLFQSCCLFCRAYRTLQITPYRDLCRTSHQPKSAGSPSSVGWNCFSAIRFLGLVSGPSAMREFCWPTEFR